MVVGEDLAVGLGVAQVFRQEDGGVHGDGDELAPGLGVALQEGRHLIQHVEIQLDNAAAVFQDGDELVGIEDGPVGLLPADQGLGTDDGQVGQRELGLEVELELVVLHGPDEAVHQLVGQGLALGRFLVVEADQLAGVR